MQDVADKLDQLERDGYVLIEGALSPQETELVRQRVDHARDNGLGGRVERRGQYVV